MVTVAPEGSVRTCKWPTDGDAAGMSMNCDTCAPAAIVTGISRTPLSLTSCSMCGPGLSDTVEGDMPRGSPSITTDTPGGLVSTTSVPVASAATDGIRYRRAAMVPPDARATSTTPAAINRPRADALDLIGGCASGDDHRL